MTNTVSSKFPVPLSILGGALLLAAAALELAAPTPALAQFAGSPRNIEVDLKAETTSPSPGQRLRVAFLMNAKPGWHGYWINPGESGAAPTVQWTLPAGASAGELKHPTPKTLTVAGMVSYVHEEQYALTSHINLPRSIAAGTTLPISATLNWLACSDQACVPEKKTLSLNLTVGDGKVAPEARRQFASFETKVPRGTASQGAVAVRDGKLHLSVAAPPGANLAAARVYALSNDYFEPSAPQSARLEDGKLVFSIPTRLKTAPAKLDAVIAPGPGARSFAMLATPALAPLPATSDVASEAAVDVEAPAISAPLVQAETEKVAIRAADTPLRETASQEPLVWAFLGAVLGGLILNLMPCVFPILSLKALSISRSGETEASAKRETLAYTAGAIAVCLALGAALIALRSAGTQVGWAFQLQDQRVILVLLLLTFAVGLNLAGVFELRGLSFGNKLASRAGASGAFWTGGLAAFVATPCSGPFMGAALGAALLLPPASALLVFAGLGLGLALPFLVIGYVPALRTRLPKPGPWMNSFRRVLAVPMFVTSIGLAWVLGRQSGVDGMTLGLISAALVAFGLWLLGRRQVLGASRPLMTAAPLVIIGLSAVFLLPLTPPLQANGLQDAGSSRTEQFSPARLAELRARNVPVFVDFTAGWCLSCKVNDKLAIDTARTKKAFAEAGVVTLVGDWTNGDPTITKFLADHQRNSIPYYLFYAPGKAAKELPQILTPALLEKTARESSI